MCRVVLQTKREWKKIMKCSCFYCVLAWIFGQFCAPIINYLGENFRLFIWNQQCKYKFPCLLFFSFLFFLTLCDASQSQPTENCRPIKVNVKKKTRKRKHEHNFDPCIYSLNVWFVVLFFESHFLPELSDQVQVFLLFSVDRSCESYSNWNSSSYFHMRPRIYLKLYYTYFKIRGYIPVVAVKKSL